MNCRKLVGMFVLGIGGLGLAASRLLSFQVDQNGLKGMAKAWIAHQGEELGIPAASQTKIGVLADHGIENVTPLLSQIYQTMGEIEKDQASKQSEKVLASHVDEIFRDLNGLVDVKDRLVEEARQSMTAKERAALIAKISSKVHEKLGTAEDIDQLGDAARTLHRAHLRGFLHLDDARMKALDAAMKPLVAQHKAERKARIELAGKIRDAVAANASDDKLQPLMAEWEKLTAKGSEIAHAHLAAARKFFTTTELAGMASHAHERIEKGLRFVALIQKFHPVN